MNRISFLNRGYAFKGLLAVIDKVFNVSSFSKQYLQNSASDTSAEMIII